MIKFPCDELRDIFFYLGNLRNVTLVLQLFLN